MRRESWRAIRGRRSIVPTTRLPSPRCGRGSAPTASTPLVGGHVPLARRRRCLRQPRPGARRRPSTGWASLTPTELRVVGLAVEGLTNPEIAARLFISRDTVKTHLSHIYAKLDVANPTELATLAASRA
jgi:DNA-binding CsgD family transcriptional regulator